MKVFREDVVKQNPCFFLAGRGGETNLHEGNSTVRKLVLNKAAMYASLDARERGQRFSHRILFEDLAGVTFVVRLSYLRRNYEKGKIAQAKLHSVISEHGSLSNLDNLPCSSYVTIGKTWCLHIIGAILRQASCRMDKGTQPHKAPKGKTPCRRSSKARAAVLESKQKKLQKIPSDTSLLHGIARAHAFPLLAKSSAGDDEAFMFTSIDTTPLAVGSDSVPLLVGSSTMATVSQSTNAPSMRRVSFCHLTEVPDASVAAERIAQQTWSIPAFPVTPNDAIPYMAFSDGFAEPQDDTDPFEVLLDDCDTTQWPQLDFFDLLAV